MAVLLEGRAPQVEYLSCDIYCSEHKAAGDGWAAPPHRVKVKFVVVIYAIQTLIPKIALHVTTPVPGDSTVCSGCIASRSKLFETAYKSI